MSPGPSFPSRRPPAPAVAAVALALVVLPGGCTISVDRLPETPGPVDLPLEPGREGVEAREGPVLRYLGVGGWLVRWRGEALLTAPFYSNPGVVRVGLWSIGPDTARIDAHLPDVSDVSAILVGHAHYDHLMDVPYVTRKHAPKAVIYGSRTMAHTLAGFTDLDDQGRLVGLNELAGDHETPGEWIEVADGRFRFMALRSSHAPHFLGQNFYHGRRTEDMTWTPGIAPDWLEGQTLAYLIDLLDGEGRTAFRIYYQDAASQPPAGMVPELPPEDRRRVDVAILCPASWEQVEGHPDRMVRNLRPRHVIMGHWENFFRDPAKPVKPIPFSDLEEFIDRLGRSLPDDAGWTLPEPGAVISVRRPGV